MLSWLEEAGTAFDESIVTESQKILVMGSSPGVWIDCFKFLIWDATFATFSKMLFSLSL